MRLLFDRDLPLFDGRLRHGQVGERSLATLSRPPVRAGAVIPIHSVPAGAAVLARARGALVDVNAAVFPREAGPASALVVVIED